MNRPDRCPESVDGWHDDGDRKGLCHWCRRRVAPPVPSPPGHSQEPSELSLYYAYYWQPDGLDAVTLR